MARNLLSEHRLPAERFERFARDAGDLVSFPDIQKAIEDHYSTCVQPKFPEGLKEEMRPVPAYRWPENQANAVNSPPELLGTVLDLTSSRLRLVYRTASSKFKSRYFRGFADTMPTRVQINDFFQEHLADVAAREDFLDELFRIVARYRKEEQDRVFPTWAAEWTSLQPFLTSSDPSNWFRAVGVYKEEPVWVVVVCYRASERKVQLFRPTQLDAGWYVHHFPSPPQAELRKGGHTMYLGQHSGSVISPPPVSEFVHEQVDFDVKDWIAGGRLAGFTREPVRGFLEQQRMDHLHFLQTIYGEGVSSWMPNCL